MPSIRVVIADDHPVLLLGMKTLLASSPRIEIVGVAHNGREAICLVEKLKPDILVLDIEMPDISGIEVAQHLHQTNADVRILVLSAYADIEFVQQMLACGVVGYMIKDEAATDLVRAIETIMHSQAPWFSASVRAQIGQIASQVSTPRQLTDREREVIRQLAKGMTNYVIAQTLQISEKTVEKHVENIYRKLNANSRAEAAVIAVHKGII